MALATRLGKYPYTYVRTLVMKKSLLTKQDYDKILKMTPEEIGKYLEDFEYKKEVDELAMEYRGIELIERALQKNLGNVFNKILRISSPDLKLLVKIYQKRYDIYNIKTILRAKSNNMPAEEAKMHMSHVYVESREFFDRLMMQNTVEDAISSLTFLDDAELRAAVEDFRNDSSLIQAENALDKYYFRYVMSQLTYLSTEGRVYRKFLLNEMDVLNIKLILRLKKENAGEQEIKGLIVGYGNIKKPAIERMLKSDMAGILKELEATDFSEVTAKYSKGSEMIDLSSLEIGLDRFLLQQSRKLIRQNPLSVDSILGYMFLKDIEVKNITRIVKSKQLSLPEDFIEKIIVI